MGSLSGMQSGQKDVTIRAVTMMTPTKTPADSMLAAEVAALKLQSILKSGEKKDKNKTN